jgi:hypothetical protein
MAGPTSITNSYATYQNTSARFVNLLDSNGVFLTELGQTQYSSIIIKTAQGRPEYIGEAAPGVNSNSTGWRIRKATYNGNASELWQWADGDANFDNIMSDYSTISYS